MNTVYSPDSLVASLLKYAPLCCHYISVFALSCFETPDIMESFLKRNM